MSKTQNSILNPPVLMTQKAEEYPTIKEHWQFIAGKWKREAQNALIPACVKTAGTLPPAGPGKSVG